MEKYAIGVDIGGTAIKFALVSESGKLLYEHSLATEAAKGKTAVLDNIMSGVAFLLAKNSVEEHREKLLGVGVGVPGVVSLDSNTVKYPPNLPGWDVVKLGDVLRERLLSEHHLQKPVFVENDANLAAFGEASFGAGRPFSDFIMITLGTGIGSGIIINRKIYRGTTGAAGELGHITIDFKSDRIHAGIRGTIEGLIGQKRIVEYAKQLAASRPTSKLFEVCSNDLDALSPRLIDQAAEAGDETAIDIWRWVGNILGAGLGAAVSILDIRKFVIGGGVAGAGEFIFGPALEQLKHYTLHSMHDGLELIPAKLGNNAGVMGGAALCF